MNTKTDKETLDKISKLEEELAILKAELQKPEGGEDIRFATGTCYVHSIPYFDKAYREFVKAGNYFKTPERAEQVAEKFRMLLKPN